MNLEMPRNINRPGEGAANTVLEKSVSEPNEHVYGKRAGGYMRSPYDFINGSSDSVTAPKSWSKAAAVDQLE